MYLWHNYYHLVRMCTKAKTWYNNESLLRTMSCMVMYNNYGLTKQLDLWADIRKVVTEVVDSIFGFFHSQVFQERWRMNDWRRLAESDAWGCEQSHNSHNVYTKEYHISSNWSVNCCIMVLSYVMEFMNQFFCFSNNFAVCMGTLLETEEPRPLLTQWRPSLIFKLYSK